MAVRVQHEPADGHAIVHFTLSSTDYPEPVSVVGNFNDWTPGRNVLIDQGDGTTQVDVEIPLGTEVRFRYLASHGRWFDEPEADEINELGSIVRLPPGSAEVDVRPAK